jgi:ABC-type dipeptide/oligopeptide/nickel transport system permease component
MGQHIAYRLLLGLPVLFAVVLFGFILIKSTPGDPAMIIAGPMATPDIVAKIRVEMGLDQPTVVQFWRYLAHLAQGDLGRSMINNTSVASELGSAIAATAELMVACMIFAVPIGIAAGTLAAVRHGRLIDRVIMAISVAGVSMPVFFVGLLLMQYLGYKWQLLPFLGRGGPVWTAEGLRHIALPAMTLGTAFVGPVARMTRASVLEVLGADYIRTARAKGLREHSVIIHHALRNALIPVVTLIGLQAGYLLGGAVVTESIYSWPGVGRLAVGAILASDLPLAQGALLVLALSFLVINLIVDVFYTLLDPRVQHA